MSSGLDRRDFLKTLGAAGTTIAASSLPVRAEASSVVALTGDEYGVLTDLTKCIGCRKCEWACNQANELPNQPIAAFEDKSVFTAFRRPDGARFTVVNRFSGPRPDDSPVYVKAQCMHCNDPACKSACIVSAFTKNGNGAVTYNAWRCMGCRYCMVACPFQIPGYEYENALTPRVMKCNLCFSRISKQGGVPACVEICPPQCLTFGKREDILALAHAKLDRHPDQYYQRVYGEHEVGGTSWLYVADRSFDQLGLPVLPDQAPPRFTERLQHGVFKHFVPPLALYAVLGGVMYLFGKKDDDDRPGGGGTGVRGGGNGSVAGARHAGTGGHADEHRAHEERAEPVRVKFWSRGALVLLLVALFGAVFGALRFVKGIGAVTNLDDQYPWGLWIAFDVATGVALAAGGFTTAALAHVFHRHRYEAIMRPALLSAMLGYTFVVLGLLADLGRYYNVWHPLLPAMWSGSSVLFEVGMCVMCYLTVLYFEFVPIFTERFMGRVNLPGMLAALNGATERLLRVLDRTFKRVMFLLVIAGVVLSCLHQSSLGSLMLIAPSKVNPLWYTPIMPLLFLLSAIAVGYPMIIMESMVSTRAFGRKPEMEVLTPLAKFTPVLLGVYLAFKIGDLAIRDRFDLLVSPGAAPKLFLFELLLPATAMVMLFTLRVRRSPRLLFTSALLVILGVAVNRLNVFLTAYHPPYKTTQYFPSIGEIAVSVGLVATLALVNRFVVTHFPVLPALETAPPARPVRRVPAGAVAAMIAAIVVMALAGAALASPAAGKQVAGHPPAASAGGHGAAAKGRSGSTDCSQCHRCEAPTAANPCLRKCPRAALKASMPSAGPDIVILDDLVDLYEPVRFNHKGHARMAGLSKGCESCHHYTPEAAAHPACRSCHPENVIHEDLAQPGLKGAYHRQCFSCHVEWDKDTACEVCHEKRAGGKLAGAARPGAAGPHGATSHYGPLEIKELIVFETAKSPGDRVPFHHRSHAQLYEPNCNACHQNESCAMCHTHGADSHPMGELSEINLHDYCFKCHRQNGRGGLPDSDCDDCHGRDPGALFNHASTGWALAPYHRKLACRSCHGEWTARARLVPACESCHEGGWDAAKFDHRVTGVVLNATHKDMGCGDCHPGGVGTAASCAGCHDDGRVWSKATGFGS